MTNHPEALTVTNTAGERISIEKHTVRGAQAIVIIRIETKRRSLSAGLSNDNVMALYQGRGTETKRDRYVYLGSTLANIKTSSDPGYRVDFDFDYDARSGGSWPGSDKIREWCRQWLVAEGVLAPETVKIVDRDGEFDRLADFVEAVQGKAKEAPVKEEKKVEPKEIAPAFKVGDKVVRIGPSNIGWVSGRGPGSVGVVDRVHYHERWQISVDSIWHSNDALRLYEENPATLPAPKFAPLPAGRKPSKGAQEAADALGSAFSWADTPEGWEFWYAVRNRLADIAKGTAPARRPDADYESPCPFGYETLAMAMLRRGRPDDATVDLGARVARKAASRGLYPVWVAAPAVALDVTDKVRAYPSEALGTILSDLGIPRA